MKLIMLLPFILIACSQRDTKTPLQKFADSVKVELMVDSIMKASRHSAMFDTTGLSTAPVKVLSAKLFKEEYSAYKSISLSWKNVSDKTITAIRFKWYGTNAFNEPADMGTSPVAGFGGGFTDDILKVGKTDQAYWSIYSRDGKKVVLAWPYEVVFADGSKWEIK